MGCECDDRQNAGPLANTCECYQDYLYYGGSVYGCSSWCDDDYYGIFHDNSWQNQKNHGSVDEPRIQQRCQEQCEMDVIEDGTANSEDEGLQVDEAFRKFLEQSAKHRQERDQKKKTPSKEDDYVEVGSLHLNTSVLPPSEQPGMRRKEEMRRLYGAKASLIMSLEASVQLCYDRHCDTRQPVYWPSIPLKF
ncbi:predicted protein [Nematostella vectensis]|uniref:Gem-associated protein 8 n=1 Tax=Nematostella vectensis TaxID=45351 RepID=A7SEI1_NEMVE|nr:predicted protein [Nematostella vectensis]|eukprot:XP_001629928.1 predicted protein [Nematostella vectensis]